MALPMVMVAPTCSQKRRAQSKSTFTCEVLSWPPKRSHTRGAGAGVVSRDYFLKRLAQAGLKPVWILAGEKNVYASQDLGGGNGFGGRLNHTTVFTVDGGSLKSFGQKTDLFKPSKEQLKALRENR